MTYNAEHAQQPDDPQSSKHPLESMPSFEQHMRDRQSAETDEKLHPKDECDRTVDHILDRLDSNAKDRHYFSNPDKLLELTKDARTTPLKSTITHFKGEIEAYKARSTDSYRQKASDIYDQTRINVSSLRKNGLVGDDAINVFLNTEYLLPNQKGFSMLEYNAIQTDYSRRERDNTTYALNNFRRHLYRVQELANSYAERGGDISYQAEVEDEDSANAYAYSPDKPIVMGQFLHVNSQRPREKGGLRCYITSDKTRDPSAVLYAWRESLENSPLRDSLYFKFATSINAEDSANQRPDDIVIYKTDNIDDGQFKDLLQDFKRRCDEMPLDILPSDEKKMPAATQKIANGISISGEPLYVNNLLRLTGHRGEGKYSWTSFVDKMTLLSISLAANRLGVRPESSQTPGLRDGTKKVFRELMLLAKVNPDTMLPAEYGDQLPSWANLSEK